MKMGRIKNRRMRDFMLRRAEVITSMLIPDKSLRNIGVGWLRIDLIEGKWVKFVFQVRSSKRPSRRVSHVQVGDPNEDPSELAWANLKVRDHQVREREHQRVNSPSVKRGRTEADETASLPAAVSFLHASYPGQVITFARCKIVFTVSNSSKTHECKSWPVLFLT